MCGSDPDFSEPKFQRVTVISGNWFGTPQRYRIDWQPTQVVFSIDGAVVATHAASIELSLRPLMSDSTGGGGILTVDLLEMTLEGSPHRHQ